jgi:3',5'-cyclic-AMP phosphodiesterase
MASSALIAQITDTHLFADPDQTLKGIKTAASLQAVLERLAALHPRPDLLLLSGDLSQDETPESYERLLELLTPLEIPAYWLAGNHDSLPVMEQCLQSPPMHSETAFAVGGWRVVLLNSALPGCVEGELAAGELAWLEAQLQDHRYQPTLLALHHPPLAVGSAWMDGIALQNPEPFLTLVDRHPQIKLVLFGHIHQAFEHQRQGICYLGSPSTCVQFQPNRQEFGIDTQAQPGFRLLHLFPDGSYETRIERVAYSLSAPNPAG